MSEELTVDLAVIGAGPGGYVAALRAQQLGLSAAVVEKEFVGGTCLNVGCIPSKALLDATHLLNRVREASTLGIRAEGLECDWGVLRAHKAKVVKILTGGVRGLLRKGGIELVEGVARFVAPGTLEVETGEAETRKIRAGSVVIATGSVEMELPGVPFDGDRVLSSRDALDLEEVPGRMIVVGAGYIGLELGSVYSRLGTEVTVLEMLDRALPEMDREVADTAAELLMGQGLDIRLGARVMGVDAHGDHAVVRYEQDGEEHTIETDRVLVAIGRRPFVEGLGLEAVGLETNARGFIPVDHGMRTAVGGIYAIGDVVPTPMLAHVAMDEGVVAAECAAGGDAAMEYDAIPAVVFTSPELASVGLTEEEVRERGIEAKVGRFPFRGNGRARALAQVDGWVKVIADAATDKILGVHCVGHEAGHLIHEAVIAMGYGGYAEDLAVAVHAHPTLAEAFKEAALAVDGRALHI